MAAMTAKDALIDKNIDNYFIIDVSKGPDIFNLKFNQIVTTRKLMKDLGLPNPAPVRARVAQPQTTRNS